MLQERIQQVNAKIAELTKKANQQYNITLPQIQVRYDLRGRVAGWAGRKGNVYFMRFNTDMLVNQSWDHMINDTVPHELAHVVCFFRETDRGHGANWRSTCIALGGSGERCHKEAVIYAKGNTYAYTTSTGHVVNVSEKIHRKILCGGVYTYRHGKGKIDMHSTWRLVTHVSQMPVAAPIAPPAAPVQREPKVAAPVVRAPVNADGGVPKSELVRRRITLAKARGEDETVVMQWAVDNLGMTRALAKTYTINNWSRV